MSTQPRVIVPNLKRRWSGVTSTLARLVPHLQEHVPIACVGFGLPKSLPQLSLKDLLRLGRGETRVWHARRNIEMAAGIALRALWGRRHLKLVFTSAAQRRHTRYTRWLIRQMDQVIATSHAAASYLAVPSIVIMHGVDGNRFRPADDKEALRRAAGLRKQAMLVDCFGRLRPQKGTDLFVEAMIAIMRTNPDVEAVLVGQVTHEHRRFVDGLKAQIATAGLADRFHFLRTQPDDAIPGLIAMLDVLVAAPRWEGFGLTPLEAMASGVPVVASRVGTFEETVVDGKGGLLVAPGDATGLRNALEALLNAPDRLKAMGDFGRQDVMARFDLSCECNALVELYNELLVRD